MFNRQTARPPYINSNRAHLMLYMQRNNYTELLLRSTRSYADDCYLLSGQRSQVREQRPPEYSVVAENGLSSKNRRQRNCEISELSGEVSMIIVHLFFIWLHHYQLLLV